MKSTAKGSLVYSDSHGPGIVMDEFTIRKQHKMLSVLFSRQQTACHVYETEVKPLQRIERNDDGSVSITFNRFADSPSG